MSEEQSALRVDRTTSEFTVMTGELCVEGEAETAVNEVEVSS